jgi:uncharacterized protein (TIGR04255 family)
VTAAASGRIVYPYPPVVEVICQVTFVEPVPWSVATPGVLWKALDDEYPAEPRSLGSVEATFDGAEGDFTVNQKGARFVFANAEQSRRIVANESCLSVNGLQPYEEWPNVADRFRRAITTFRKNVAAFTPASVNIRYINRIIIPFGELDVNQYFTLPVVRAHQEKAVIQGFISRSQCLVEETGVMTTITFGSAPHPPADEAAFILDIELAQPVEGSSTTGDLVDAVENLHRLENQEFEASVTDKCRELFHGNNR